MIGTISILCPPMPVLNTGLPKILGMRIKRARSDREAQELRCTGYIEIGGRQIGFMPVESDHAFRFPKCRVYNVKVGQWMVEPVVAWGRTVLGEEIQISYPQEPIFRTEEGMVAQPIKNHVWDSYVYVDGIRHPIEAGLPKAVGKPDDGFFGLFSYLVEQVEIHGTIGV